MTRNKRWSKAELQKLESLYEQYRASPDLWNIIATALDRSGPGVQLKARALGLTRRVDRVSEYDVHHVAELLGRDPTSVLEWIRRGKFGRTVTFHRKRSQYVIEPDRLWAWMEDMRSWHLWEPEALQDAAWREHFGELRAEWLTTREAAQLLQVSMRRVTQLYRTGVLVGVKTSDRSVWFRCSEIAAYQMHSRTLEQQVGELLRRISRLESILENRGVLLLEDRPRKPRAPSGRLAASI